MTKARNFDIQYQELLAEILEEGSFKEDRTGVGCYTISGAQIKVDLRKSFPVSTLRELPGLKGAFGEMINMLKGNTSVESFKEHGCNFWDANANKNEAWLANPFRKGEGDNGKIYGHQWRKWDAYKLTDNDLSETESALLLKALEDFGFGYHMQDDIIGETLHHKEIDQLMECLLLIKNDPGSRRILFHGWNPADMNEMSLPPCHMTYQFVVCGNFIDLVTYQRSCDSLIGLPANIIGASYLLEFVCALMGYSPRYVTLNLGDAHIYANHVEAAKELISRTAVEQAIGINVFLENYDFIGTIEGTDEEFIENVNKVIDSMSIKNIVLSEWKSLPKLPKEMIPMAV